MGRVEEVDGVGAISDERRLETQALQHLHLKMGGGKCMTVRSWIMLTHMGSVSYQLGGV